MCNTRKRSDSISFSCSSVKCVTLLWKVTEVLIACFIAFNVANWHLNSVLKTLLTASSKLILSMVFKNTHLQNPPSPFVLHCRNFFNGFSLPCRNRNYCNYSNYCNYCGNMWFIVVQIKDNSSGLKMNQRVSLRDPSQLWVSELLHSCSHSMTPCLAPFTLNINT